MEILGRSEICRLCADIKDHFIRIYDEEGYKLALGIKINKYLQIQIDEKDSLPKNVCWDCYTKLEECSNFVNNSQNAQITLTQKIFSLYNDENSLKEENVFPHESLIHQSTNILNFDTEQLEKNGEVSDTFSCNNVNISSSNSSCYYNNKPSDCLFVERSENIENTSNVNNDSNINSTECNQHFYNARKRFNRRKCVTPIRYLINNTLTARNKRKLCRKKKIPLTKKKKADFVNDQEQEDYSENESEVFKQKYFSHIPWMCTGCKENFQTLSELHNHHANYHLQSPRYMCPYCYKVYMQYKGFISHIKKQQCVAEFACDECSKIFSSRKMLQTHQLIHTEKRPYQCSHCDKSFRQQSGLYMHTRCHLPEHLKVGYTCDQCDKNFSTKPNLVTHKKIHTGMRNYTCDLCGKSFVQKGNLCAHMLTHSDNKPFICETCNKEFKTLMQLRKHNNVHTGKKPHQCDMCGRTFRERGTLREHYRIHTGAMPFSCEFCGKAFRFKGVLTTHRRQHTGERPYSCIECQHHFTNWPNYNKHMKRRHGINKSRTNRIKSDNVQQSSNIPEENVDSNCATDIEIPSFEDTLQPVPIDNDKTIRMFDELPSEPYLISHQNYTNISACQQQNSILNAYYNMTALQVMNPVNQNIDIMNGNMNRDFI